MSNIIKMTVEEMEELEELIAWNRSFGISVLETLMEVGKEEYYRYFIFLEEQSDDSD